MLNNLLAAQLQKALDEKKIKVVYPDGYRAWKQKFDYWYNITHSVSQTLDIIYGPGGSVGDYKGSIYQNSKFKPKETITKSSNAFKYLKSKGPKR